MKRRRYIAAVALALCLGFASVAPAAASDGGGGSTGTGGPGGVSGGGDTGGGGLGAFGSCGSGRVLAVYDNDYWNGVKSSHPYASATQTAAAKPSDKSQFKDHIYPTYKGHDNSIVFLVDPSNGYAWGPSDLGGYSATRGTPPGEGFPPDFVGPFDASGNSPGWNSTPGWYHAGWEDWSCFDGSLPTVTDAVPTDFLLNSFNKGTGNKTTTNIGASGLALVFDKITATPKDQCQLFSDVANPASNNVEHLLPLNTGGSDYPSGGKSSYYTAGPNDCPDFGLSHGATAPTGTWQWYEYEFPITASTPIAGASTCKSGTSFTGSPTVSACPPAGLNFSGATCNSGSGYFDFDWEPNPYVPSANSPDCTNSATDQEQFIHVHTKTTTKASGPCTANTCGLNVTMSEKWGAYECLGTITDTANPGETWTWRLFTGQSMAYTYPTGDSYTLSCNTAADAGFTQVYDTSPGVSVEQIESVPSGH